MSWSGGPLRVQRILSGKTDGESCLEATLLQCGGANPLFRLALRVEGLSKRYRTGKSRGLFERSNVSTFQRSNADVLWALKDVSFPN